MGMNKL